MENPISKRLSSELYTSSLWVMRARWYYSFLAYVLALLSVSKVAFTTYVLPLSLLLAIVIVLNAILAFYLEHNSAEKLGEVKLWYINVGQVVFDLIYFFLMMVLSGSGLNSFVQIFFFIPIIVSMMFFGFRGSIAVSAISSVFLLVSVLSETGFLYALFKAPNNLHQIYVSEAFRLKVGQSGVMSLIYILIGFFSASVSKMLDLREGELQKQFLIEESNVRKLSDLTRDFEQSSKLLVRRDIELTIANERMQELDTMKTEIISVAAHQLRTPLSGIKWMMKLVLDGDIGPLNKDQKEWLSRGYDTNDRLIRTVNDLLEVDRLESGRIKYVFKDVKLEDMIEMAIAGVLPKASFKKMHISYSSTGAIPSLYVDEERIVDMLQNLIENAIKYSREGTVVSITSQVAGDYVRISVSDTGIGIPESDYDKIFSRFFRASNAMQFATEGSGLGLSIVNNVVQRHAGKISFSSKENEGTTFTVELPINNESSDK